MTGEQIVEWWLSSLFGGWEFLGENTVLTYFLVGGVFAAMLCNTFYCRGYLEDLNAIGALVVYFILCAASVFLWCLLPAFIIPVYFVVVLGYTINDQIGKAKKDVRRKQ